MWEKEGMVDVKKVGRESGGEEEEGECSSLLQAGRVEVHRFM